MAFPATALPIGVELLIAGTWTDVSGDVYTRDKVQITRGRANEGNNAEPASMSVTLDNRTKNYSPRNPTGAYFGSIGRNTKVRAYVKNGQPRLRLTSGQQFTCADSAGTSITGDIDIRADVVLATWRPTVACYFGAPFKGNSYGMYLNNDGTLVLWWYQATVFMAAASTEPVPGATTGRKSVRATLDVDNGAAGWTATFYYSNDDTMDGTWVQFGSTVITAGTTSIDDTAQAMGVYASGDACPCEVNEGRVYQGIAGTKRASPKFISQATGTTSFADAEGNTWSDSGATGAALDNKHYRFWGDASSWQPRRDRSGNDLYVQLECSGQTRRLGQGSTPLKSALRRGIPAVGSDLVGYWPCEDGADATSLEPGLSGEAPGRVIGKPTLAGYSNFVASAPVPTLQTNGRLLFQVPQYANTTEFQVRFIMHVPPNTVPSNTVLLRIKTNSSMGWIDWIYQTGDVMYLQCYTNLGIATAAGSMLDITNQVSNQDTRVSLEFAKNGTGVDVKQVVLPIGETSGLFTTSTIASITLGSCTQVYVNPDGANLGDFAIGHITVEKNITSVFDSVHALERAYQGEAAHTRIARLCSENSVTCNLRGGGEGTEFLGYQGRSALLTLLQEAATADGGILTEQRDADALIYRTRESIYNQPSRATINYAAENLQGFTPTEDDQRTRNKVTVSRSSGQAFTVEDTDSRLSTSAIGVYDDSASVSLYSDGQAQHQAGWKVRLGTVDEARYPGVEINLAHPDYAADSSLTRRMLSLDVGDRLTVTNPPADLPPETIGQIVQGYTETFWQFEHTIAYTLVPSAPYRAAVYEDHPNTLSRFSNENTTVNGAHNSSTTSLSVAFTAGPIWTHADGDFDIMVNGERMTVTAVAGASSPQTLTVTRSVNGVNKAHSNGEAVALFDPAYYALGASPGSGLYLDVDEGRKMRALDYSLPDVVAEYGNGTNTITATSFSALPSFPCKSSITNPHPGASMLCIVAFGAWGLASANDVRLALRVSRAEQDYINAGIGAGASVGWGEIPAEALTTTSSMFATVTVSLDPSSLPYAFEVQALRTTAGTQDIRYATLRIIPLRYINI
jgi:hypothetical protein